MTVEVRVHGVGGPQGVRILGEASPDDTTVVAADHGTRVLRRIPDDGVEAFEWGGLTSGSAGKALWVVLLPFTIVNLAGWATNGRARSLHTRLVHAVAITATGSYVAWTGVLMLDVVALQWRRRATAAWPDGAAHELVRWGLPVAAVALVAGVAVGLAAVALRSSARFEAVGTGGGAGAHGAGGAVWSANATVSDPDFYAHPAEHARRLRWHAGMAAVVAAGGLALAGQAVGREHSRIGLVVMGLGAIQVACCIVLSLATARRGRPATGAAAATLGAVMANAAFAGTTLLAADRLSQWPSVPGDAAEAAGALIIGPELGLADAFTWALVATVLASAAVTLRGWRRRLPAIAPDLDGEPSQRSAAVVRARRVARTVHGIVVYAHLLAAAFLVASVVSGAVLVMRGGVSHPIDWYDSYRYVSDTPLQRWAGAVLTALPLAVGYALQRSLRDSRFRLTIGTVWDIATFWPRRFHPFAVPSYAERAVPLLRQRIADHVACGPVIVSSHSQGTVLAHAAVAQLADGADGGLGPHPLLLVTYGSPLGTLYADAFGDHYRPETVAALQARLAERRPGDLINLYRLTDPIGGPAFAPGHANDVVLADPVTGPPPAPDPAEPPRERDRSPFDGIAGHSDYQRDATLKRLVRDWWAAVG